MAENILTVGEGVSARTNVAPVTVIRFASVIPCPTTVSCSYARRAQPACGMDLNALRVPRVNNLRTSVPWTGYWRS